MGGDKKCFFFVVNDTLYALNGKKDPRSLYSSDDKCAFFEAPIVKYGWNLNKINVALDEDSKRTGAKFAVLLILKNKTIFIKMDNGPNAVQFYTLLSKQCLNTKGRYLVNFTSSPPTICGEDDDKKKEEMAPPINPKKVENIKKLRNESHHKRCPTKILEIISQIQMDEELNGPTFPVLAEEEEIDDTKIMNVPPVFNEIHGMQASADYVYEEEHELDSMPFPPPSSIRIAMMKEQQMQSTENSENAPRIPPNVQIPPPAPSNALSPVPSITENVMTPPDAPSNLYKNPLHQMSMNENVPPMNQNSNNKLTEKIKNAYSAYYKKRGRAPSDVQSFVSYCKNKKNIKKANWSICESVMNEETKKNQQNIPPPPNINDQAPPPPSISFVDYAEEQHKKQQKELENRLKAEQEQKRREYEEERLKKELEAKQEKERLERERIKAEQEKDAMRRELEATKAKMAAEEQKRRQLEEETKKLREAQQSQLPQPSAPNWQKNGMSVEDALAHDFAADENENSDNNDSSSDGYTSSSDYTTDSEFSGDVKDAKKKKKKNPTGKKKKKKKKKKS